MNSKILRRLTIAEKDVPNSSCSKKKLLKGIHILGRKARSKQPVKNASNSLRRVRFQNQAMNSSAVGCLSKLQEELNNYSYVPKDDTISKLKYYYGPYNQVKGFRKFMDLPKGFECSETKNSEELWNNISSYILQDKEGTLRKLPFRLEKYTDPAYSTNIQKNLIKDDSHKRRRKTRFTVDTPSTKNKDSKLRFNILNSSCLNMDSGLRQLKAMSHLLTPVARSQNARNSANCSFSGQSEKWFDRLSSGFSTMKGDVTPPSPNYCASRQLSTSMATRLEPINAEEKDVTEDSYRIRCKPSTPVKKMKRLENPLNLSYASYGYRVLDHKDLLKTPKKSSRKHKKSVKTAKKLASGDPMTSLDKMLLCDQDTCPTLPNVRGDSQRTNSCLEKTTILNKCRRKNYLKKRSQFEKQFGAFRTPPHSSSLAV